MLGIAILKRDHGKTYQKLITSIWDKHTCNKDLYPKSLHDAYKLLENYISVNKGTSKGGIYARGDRRGDSKTPLGRGDRGGRKKRDEEGGM